MGIDPDGRVHVSERLPRLHDGPLLEQILKAAAGALIRLPRPSSFTRTEIGLPLGSSRSSTARRGSMRPGRSATGFAEHPA
jgi:hypothetical protein